MEALFIEKKEFIPQVDFNPVTGILEISGQSYHEYTGEFFEPLLDWIRTYLSEPNRNVSLNFKLKYFNTASSKYFFTMVELLQEYDTSGLGTAIVNWYYPKKDEDMRETGEDYIYDADWNGINLISY